LYICKKWLNYSYRVYDFAAKSNSTAQHATKDVQKIGLFGLC
jgi:hypothetical protein